MQDGLGLTVFVFIFGFRRFAADRAAQVRGHSTAMSDNPLPLGYEHVQKVWDAANKTLHDRPADERTEIGNEKNYTKYIVAHPIAVRLLNRTCNTILCRTHPALLVAQVSLRANVNPGRSGVNLKVADFKHSRRLFYLRSREKPDVIWLESLSLSDPIVEAYAERNKRDYPDQCYLDAGDSFDAFCAKFSTKDGRAALITEQQVPLKKGDVGEAFPCPADLGDIIAYIDGMFCALEPNTSAALPLPLLHLCGTDDSCVCSLSRAQRVNIGRSSCAQASSLHSMIAMLRIAVLRMTEK